MHDKIFETFKIDLENMNEFFKSELEVYVDKESFDKDNANKMEQMLELHEIIEGQNNLINHQR